MNRRRQEAVGCGGRGRLPLQYCLIALPAVWLPMLLAAPLPQRPKTTDDFSIRWIPDPSNTNQINVEVSGLSAARLQALQKSDWKRAQWQRLLPVYAEQRDVVVDIGLPPMAGAYLVESDSLRFVPQFPLEPGLTYRAIFHPDQLPGEAAAGNELIAAAYQAPARQSTVTTAVTRVYPSAEVLPENLLKFYIHFSAPMSRGHIYDHIHLWDENGKEIELPFLELDEELWNPTMTRLTLFIDPGRIKRGVRPLEEVGPALQDGKRYTLVIDPAWRDATGNPLTDTFRKAFKVGPPDRDPPDPARWRIQPPKSESRDPLWITFSESMDHALAGRVIRVTDASAESVAGSVTLEDQERQWKFVPNGRWRRGTYHVVVHTTIEDLAGNNIGKPFEVDLFEGIQRRLTNPAVKLPFEVR